jgi:hypothetical protein
MPQGDQSADKDKQKRRAGAIGKSAEQKGAARPAAQARAWTSLNKVHGGAQKIASGRKVPSGPVGGSGRKTNLARSS